VQKVPLMRRSILFDGIVSTGEQRRWDGDAERLGCFGVDYQV